jgi:hypothetical protein
MFGRSREELISDVTSTPDSVHVPNRLLRAGAVLVSMATLTLTACAEGTDGSTPITGSRPDVTAPPLPAPTTVSTIEPGGPIPMEVLREVNRPS